MKYLIHITIILLAGLLSFSRGCKLVCYYDISSGGRVGPARFTAKDMELALRYCTHVIYSYVTLAPKTFSLTVWSKERERQLANMQLFKNKYPNIKFLLSISGENTWKSAQSYLQLLEQHHHTRRNFIQSAVDTLNKYKFDGLSLDFPLPREKPMTPNLMTSKIWNFLKSLFKKKHIEEDTKPCKHRIQLTALIKELYSNLREHKKILTLNVMPNVNSEKYFDIIEIVKHLDFIILSAFDFYTPERNPKEADLMSPIKPLGRKRLGLTNIKDLYKYWHSLNVPRNKIIIGVAAYGRSWKMTKRSNSNGIPPVYHTDGPGAAGPQTYTPGLLSLPEICQKISHDPKLTRISDSKAKAGVYAFRPANSAGNFGIWISYEDPITVAAKAQYVVNHNLGGVALFEIDLDDIHGECTSGERFPLLKSINFVFKTKS